MRVVTKKVTLKTVKSPSKKRMVISWKKLSGIAGYEVLASPHKEVQ